MSPHEFCVELLPGGVQCQHPARLERVEPVLPGCFESRSLNIFLEGFGEGGDWRWLSGWVGSVLDGVQFSFKDGLPSV